MSKVTVKSPANIAFIKYWGVKDQTLYLPYNTSISMNLSGCLTTTTAQIDDSASEDTIHIKEKNTFIPLSKTHGKNAKAYDQIDRLRNMLGERQYIKIYTENSFPSDAGIASSASGFSALTASILLAFGRKDIFEDKKALSRLVRLAGSGSAVRSVYGGFVEFSEGDDQAAVAHQIAAETHWDIIDLIAVVSTVKKDISSSEGHTRVESSQYFETRLKELPDRINHTRKAILDKKFSVLGPLIEADTISMHTVMMTSEPPIFYWQPGTLEVMNAVTQWRREGLESYFSIDAGANVHIICEKKNAPALKKRLQGLSLVHSTIYNEPCIGTHEIQDHLL